MAATLAACSGGKSGKGDDGSQPTPTDTNATPQPTSVVETERIDQGDAMVQARNRNAAGFQTDMASRTVTVTQTENSSPGVRVGVQPAADPHGAPAAA